MDKKPLWTKNFIVIVSINFLIFFGFEMLITTTSLYIKQIGGSDSAVGWSMGFFTAAALISRPVAGILLDRFGRRGVFIVGLCAMAVITVLHSFIAAVSVIMAVRFIHGISWGAASTASNTIASDTIPKSRFGEGMGYFGLSNSLGMALGPGLGLMILSWSNFRSMFMFSGFTVVLALIVSFLMSMKKGSELQREAQLQGASQANGGRRRGVLYEKTATVPAITIFFVCATYGALTGFLALFAQQEGIVNIGIYFSVYAVAMVFSRPVAGKLIDKHGFGIAVYPGLVLTAAALGVLYGAHELPQFLLSAVFYGIGFGAVQAALQTMAVIDAPGDRVGAANATFFMGFDVGIGLGSVIAGLVASSLGYGAMYLTFIIFVMVATVFFFFTQIRNKWVTGKTHKKNQDAKI